MNDWLERNRGYLLIVLLNFIALGAMLFMVRRPTSPGVEILLPTPAPPPTAVPTPTPVPLMVYVSGAVARPDVYALPQGSRVKQAIEAAGGFLPEADEARVNLALPLYDGQQVHVPRVGEASLPPAASGGGTTGASSQNPVNINTASLADLEALPGIGPALAQRIIDFRQANGQFERIEDIKHVRGIGDATFESLREYITVR